MDLFWRGSNVTQLRYRDKDIVNCEGYKPRLALKKMKMMQKVSPACLVTPWLNFNFESPSAPVMTHLHTNLTNLNLCQKYKTKNWKHWFNQYDTKPHQPRENIYQSGSGLTNHLEVVGSSLNIMYQLPNTLLNHYPKNINRKNHFCSMAVTRTFDQA